LTLNFERSALVIVDMQYGDAHRDYGLLKDKRAAGQIDAVEAYASRLDNLVIPNIQRLQTAFRDNGGEVIFIRIESLTMDGRDRGAGHAAKGIHFPPGSKQGQILEDIKPIGDELVLSKTCGDAFEGTNLDYLLRNMHRDHVVVVGVVTGSCVRATSIGALERGYTVCVVDDATATWNDEMQQDALTTLRERGAQVVTTDVILRAEVSPPDGTPPYALTR
jgi:nicotinamidase-related amidase